MKLSINNLYVVSIYVLVDRNKEGELIKQDIKFVRKAIVYKGNMDIWYDLETGDKYTISAWNLCNIGGFFINMDEDIIPLTDLMEFEKSNLSKRKILKKVNTNKQNIK